MLEELIDPSQIPTPAYANDPFLIWLRRGIDEGLIETNESGAWVHILPEGVLLASPAIFRAYAASIGEPQAWSKAQSYEERSTSPSGEAGDASACAFMELARPGAYECYGVGIDANIVTASLRALISGVNRLGQRED